MEDCTVKGLSAEFPEITKTSNYEANTADAMTLKKFIRFCKAHYPAEHYALVVVAHGSGPHMCYDEGSEGDAMYTAEITDVLTAEDSVDIMVLDVCLMAGVENAYQWRPGKDNFGADVLIASAPSTGPFAYDKVFERLRSGGGDNGEEDTLVGGKEKFCDPATMTALDFGGVFIEEIRDSNPEESWACLDLTKVEALALRAAHGGWRDPARGAVALATAVTIGHGTCVEIVQAFVPGREARLGDLAAAALGFAIGLALYAAYPRRAR